MKTNSVNVSDGIGLFFLFGCAVNNPCVATYLALIRLGYKFFTYISVINQRFC